MSKPIKDELYDALTALVADFDKSGGEPVGDSDLDDEQPKHMWTTLGAIRRARRAIRRREAILKRMTDAFTGAA